MTAEMDERTRQLWHQAYLQGERVIELEETLRRLSAADILTEWMPVAQEHSAAERILADLLEKAGLPQNGERLVSGAGGLMDLARCDEGPMAVWREEPVDVRPVRPERLWDGRERRSANPSRLPLYNRFVEPVEVEHAG
jgi:hypothetical protein